MGAGIGQAHGIEKAIKDTARGNVVAVIGDSTFLHSGITGLLNASYNKGTSTIIILDNRFTAMTGGQEHPGTGLTMNGEVTNRIEFGKLCQALEVGNVRTVNPYNLEETATVIEEEVNRPELSVIISDAPCIFNRREFSPFACRYEISEEDCTSCRRCLAIGCPALGWEEKRAEGSESLDRRKQKPGFARIDPLLCIGCSVCEQVCKAGAIKKA
jgi:indolepyruvate ferredoxin oxidoreductase alpha subunit